MSTVPKAVLYYSPGSIWSSVALLALEEKGYGSDEVDLKPVDLSKGENYDTTYLRINSKATVPALVVPLANTLSEEVESRYKAITDSKAIVEFLDKSRSATSTTHTTSTAPAPTLTPATVEFTNISNQIITLLHSDIADPNRLLFFNAYDDASLQALAKAVLPGIVTRHAALEKNLSEAASGRLQVSDKVIKLWSEKKAEQEKIYAVLSEADKSVSELTTEGKRTREAFMETAAKAWEDAKGVIVQLNKEIRGPFILGDQFSVADVHAIGWLARVLRLSGARVDQDGSTATGQLERRIGLELDGKLGRTGEYWTAVKTRRAWLRVYAVELH
ncbi:hypothetical protein APHAL10511_006394 [Amanita phalloides]|nr:hypothetical protein APHAL10511_006394 [Amanita phalloides]